MYGNLIQQNFAANPNRRGGSGALAGGAECGGEDDEGGAIEHHPMTREAAPLKCGVLTFGSRARRLLKDEGKEVDEGVGEKEIEEVAKSVGRSFGDRFPEIFSVRAADALLGNENGWEKDNENTCMKKKEEILGRHATAEDGTDVNPDTKQEPDQRQKGKETYQGL